MSVRGPCDVRESYGGRQCLLVAGHAGPHKFSKKAQRKAHKTTAGKWRYGS